MDKIPEVETAKALMAEALSWSVMRWLKEKKRVRTVADQANASLDQRADALRKTWPEQLTMIYEALSISLHSKNHDHNSNAGIDRELRRMAQSIRQADQNAYAARMEAERIFDEAERKLSTALAREGCRTAIHAWDLKEKAIRKMEIASAGINVESDTSA